MSSRQKILGFSISNFRSFSEKQYVGPFEDINVIIGPNNSGKSNILRYIRNVYPHLARRDGYTVREFDNPRRRAIDNETFSILLHRPFSGVSNAEVLRSALERHPAASLRRANEYWVDFRLNNNGRFDPDFEMYKQGDQQYKSLIGQIWRSANPNTSGGSFEGNWMPDVMNRVVVGSIDIPRVVFIPAFRKIDSRLEEYSEDYGHDPNSKDMIIEELAELSQPPYNEQQKKKKFQKIVKFVREILNEPSVDIEIPHDRKTITIHMHDKSLPIEALGTGLHELIIIASRAVVASNSVILIEEPELHFHPELQRKFMKFISNETDNQYFITTHSAHIMDAVPCSIHRVTLESGVSRVTRPVSGNDRREVCHELGYRPSDLLQSNCVVWVEGPSDRIYVQHWLNAKAPELVEGLHYSIMFYGGALRSHLSGLDTLLTDLIALLPINRYPVMVIDSDREKQYAQLNTSKKRIVAELGGNGGLAWVTQGREIENYVPAKVLSDAIGSVHPKFIKLASKDRRYGKPLNYLRQGSSKPVTGNFDKVAIAKKVCEQPAVFTEFDLEKRINELISYINKANRL